MQLPQMDHPETVYKIIDRDAWEVARPADCFAGAAVDLADGYIHFSTSEQARETAGKHFAGQDNLVLVAVDASALGDDLVWELSRGGALFPHLYAQLAMDAVLREIPLPMLKDGNHEFPDEIA